MSTFTQPRWAYQICNEFHCSHAMPLQDNDVLQRRLLLGVLATVALGAFALVPTDSLRQGKPTKPLFLYLIPLIRVQVSLLLAVLVQTPSLHSRACS